MALAPSVLERFQGCLLGGAVGDALGAPVEFLKRDQILDRFGPDGITAFVPAYGRVGAITDDTQMTLFTAEGLLRGWVRGSMRGIGPHYPSVVGRAYLRWLRTQLPALGEQWASLSQPLDAEAETGWLFQQRDLHNARAPGLTCLSALRAMPRLGEPATNGSKGCGGVMRAGPVGLFCWRTGRRAQGRATLRLGAELAAVTHGHPTGQLTAGALAVLIEEILDGRTLTEALATVGDLLRAEERHAETLEALLEAGQLAASGLPHEESIARLGEGWIAEEALAIAVYCALVADDFRHGVVLAVNHDGDSDSTGAIAGNLLGTMYGVAAIPAEWLEALELREVITEVANDLHAFRDWAIGESASDEALNRRIWAKYPGS